jgi:hypothetical protein
MLAMAVVEIAIVLMLALGLGLEFEGEDIVGLTLFGRIAIPEVGFLVKALLPRWIQTATYLFILAEIALAATRWTELLSDPRLEILLTAGVGRSEAILWNMIGGIAAFWLHLIALPVATGCLLVWKGWGGSVAAFVPGGASLIWWAAVVFCWSFLITMVTGHHMSVLVTLTALFLVLGPLLGSVQSSGRPMIAALTLIIPPVQRMSEWTTSVLLRTTLPDLPLMPTVITPIACFMAGLRMFQKSDL